MRFATRPLPIVALSLFLVATASVQPPAARAAAANKVGRVVNVIRTSEWSPKSPDPTGLAFIGTGSSARLLVVDSEVEETPLFGKNMWRATRDGRVEKSWDITAWNNEPTGIAVSAATGRVYIAKDGIQRIWEIDRGADGKFGSPDDTRRSWNTSAYSMDPEALAHGNGKLFIGDALERKVVVLSRGPDHTFGTVDDTRTSFGTSGLGVRDPEGVAYNPTSGNIFLIGNQPDADIIVVTESGAWVRTIDLRDVPVNAAGGLEYGPASTNASVRHFYIADRGVDNNVDPSENDGKIWEVAEVVPSDTANFLENGSFEKDRDGNHRPDGWSTNPMFSRSGAEATAGNYSGRHASNADATYSVRQTIVGIDAGTSYDFSGSVKIPTTADAFKFFVRIQWRTPRGNLLATNQLAKFTASTSGWADVTKTVTAPPGAVKANVVMSVNSLNATIYVDAFKFVKSP
jgi:hypothetical protein